MAENEFHLPMRPALAGLGSGVGASGKTITRFEVPFPVRPASFFPHHERQIATETLGPRRETYDAVSKFQKNPSVATVSRSDEVETPRNAVSRELLFLPATTHPLPASCSRGQVQRTNHQFATLFSKCGSIGNLLKTQALCLWQSPRFRDRCLTHVSL
jgi:hypothetical protein